MKVRTALFPLHTVSRIFCISAFSLKQLQQSSLDILLTICGAIVYITFYLIMLSKNTYYSITSESKRNLIGILIDCYNRYSGFCVFCILVITSILTQSKIIKGIEILEAVDSTFYSHFCSILIN